MFQFPIFVQLTEKYRDRVQQIEMRAHCHKYTHSIHTTCNVVVVDTVWTAYH